MLVELKKEKKLIIFSLFILEIDRYTSLEARSTIGADVSMKLHAYVLHTRHNALTNWH